MGRVEQPIVEGILRDVLTSQGVHVSTQRVERTATGWRIIVVDQSQRMVTTEVSDGPPAAIRTALLRWTDEADDLG